MRFKTKYNIGDIVYLSFTPEDAIVLGSEKNEK